MYPDPRNKVRMRPSVGSNGPNKRKHGALSTKVYRPLPTKRSNIPRLEIVRGGKGGSSSGLVRGTVWAPDLQGAIAPSCDILTEVGGRIRHMRQKRRSRFPAASLVYNDGFRFWQIATRIPGRYWVRTHIVAVLLSVRNRS